MSKKNFILALMGLLVLSIHAQNDFSGKLRKPSNANSCKACMEPWNNKPSDVELRFFAGKDRDLMLYCSDKTWLKKILPSQFEMLSVEIVAPSDYSCNALDAETGNFRGYVTAPKPYTEIISGAQKSAEGTFTGKFGTIPTKFTNTAALEFNLVLVRNGFVCHSEKPKAKNNSSEQRVLNLPVAYRGVVVAYDKVSKEEGFFAFKGKNHTYQLQATQGAANIKTLFPDIDFENNDVVEANIRIFTSIDGDIKAKQLQQKNWVKQWVSQIASNQTIPIENKVNTHENWMDFYSTIKTSTEYKHFWSVDQQGIQMRLRDEKVAADIASLLKGQDKIMVELEVLPKTLTAKTIETLDWALLTDAIEDEDWDFVAKFQSLVLNDLQMGKGNPEWYNKLVALIPQTQVNLHNDLIMYDYLVNNRDLGLVKSKLESLHTQNHKNPELVYNLAVINMEQWAINLETYNPSELTALLDVLRENSFQAKMLPLEFGYFALQSEAGIKIGEIEKSLLYQKKLNANIGKAKTYEDKMWMANAMATSGQHEVVLKILSPELDKPIVSEALAFAYLESALVSENTQGPKFKKAMDLALLYNKDQYCSFFDPKNKQRLSFQLLGNKLIGEPYCQACMLEN